ncbi:MAG: hypothetical protein A4E51_01555 [Methanosaeta sp. PtaU1.Bin055]|nr:MAG: hypothetical protein A4E51_01555 [Methanosaeta sp. PtaU1.Bin055]
MGAGTTAECQIRGREMVARGQNPMRSGSDGDIRLRGEVDFPSKAVDSAAKSFRKTE